MDYNLSAFRATNSPHRKCWTRLLMFSHIIKSPFGLESRVKKLTKPSDVVSLELTSMISPNMGELTSLLALTLSTAPKLPLEILACLFVAALQTHLSKMILLYAQFKDTIISSAQSGKPHVLSATSLCCLHESLSAGTNFHI
ncbi:hypothetical protein Ancab_015711 [Ancistrocladus abbreviatus]